MPACCIKQCGAAKNKNQPQLSLHRFPRNERLKKKWLDVIGEENINPRHKEWYVCSLHFEESCFNRTLDVMRLYDNSVPTMFLVVHTEKLKALAEKCVKQQQKVKRLNEMVRRKNKKIANLNDIIEDLRRKNCINVEQAVVIEELAGLKDFLKRQKSKSKSKISLFIWF